MNHNELSTPVVEWVDIRVSKESRARVWQHAGRMQADMDRPGRVTLEDALRDLLDRAEGGSVDV